MQHMPGLIEIRNIGEAFALRSHLPRQLYRSMAQN